MTLQEHHQANDEHRKTHDPREHHRQPGRQVVTEEKRGYGIQGGHRNQGVENQAPQTHIPGNIEKGACKQAEEERNHRGCHQGHPLVDCRLLRVKELESHTLQARHQHQQRGVGQNVVKVTAFAQHSVEKQVERHDDQQHAVKHAVADHVGFIGLMEGIRLPELQRHLVRAGRGYPEIDPTAGIRLKRYRKDKGSMMHRAGFERILIPRQIAVDHSAVADLIELDVIQERVGNFQKPLNRHFPGILDPHAIPECLPGIAKINDIPFDWRPIRTDLTA